MRIRGLICALVSIGMGIGACASFAFKYYDQMSFFWFAAIYFMIGAIYMDQADTRNERPW